MGPILSSLVQLQIVELELRKTRKKLKKGQLAVAAQEQRIVQLQAALAAKHEEIKLTRLQYSKLELELRTREDEIAKLRVALNTAKTNKDYSAILTRINTDKASKSKFEDQILQLMTQIDADQSACREIERDIQAQQQQLEELSQQSQLEQQTLQAVVDDLTRQYQEAYDSVPPKERHLFERLADHFDGQVMVEVATGNARRSEYLCGGCFMSIPLEVVNTLMSRDELITCPNCGRFLVLDLHGTQQPSS